MVNMIDSLIDSLNEILQCFNSYEIDPTREDVTNIRNKWSLIMTFLNDIDYDQYPGLEECVNDANLLINEMIIPNEFKTCIQSIKLIWIDIE